MAAGLTLLDAEVLAPFYYHGLYAMDGTATDPTVVTDTSLLFALKAALIGNNPLLRASPDYKSDISALPWRASLLLGENNGILPPLRRTVDMEREGGRSARVQKTMSSGFYKNQFFTHSVDVGAHYHGLLIGPNPFEISRSHELIVRIGVGRSGILRLTPSTEDNRPIRLNAATAQLFERFLVEEYRILDTIRPTPALTVEQATTELQQWGMR